MFKSLGLTSEQIYGDVYTSWLRDTFEKPTEESKQLFRDMIELGFAQERQIILPRQRLGINTICSLAAILHLAPIVKLNINGNALRDVGCEVVAKLLGDLPQLIHLDIGTNCMGNVGAAALGVAVARHSRLSVLIVSSRRSDPYANIMTPEGAAVLLEGCLRCRSLRTLDLSGNLISAEKEEATNAGDGTPLGPSATTGSGGNNKTKNLNSLAQLTATTSFSGTSTKAIVRDPANEAVADASDHHNPVKLLEKLLQTSLLTTLCLKDVGLRGPGALRLIAALESNMFLNLLDLSDNKLPGEVGVALGELMNRRSSSKNHLALSILRLNGNHFFSSPANAGASWGDCSKGGSSETPMGGLPLVFSNGSRNQSSAAARTHHSTSLCHSLTHGKHAEHTAAPLLLSLSYYHVLTTLELDRCGVELSAIHMLCRALLTNVDLQCLSLRDNYITSEAAVNLGRVLCSHPTLKKLYLAGNPIEDEGVCALAIMLSGNREADKAPSDSKDKAMRATLKSGFSPETAQHGCVLEVLDLQRTRLGDRGLISLGVALRRNTSLRVLLLHDNFFTYYGGECFTALVEENHSLVRCRLGATSVPHAVIIRLQACMARNVSALERAEPDALRREVVYLHYQKYKLEEAKIELENLRDQNNEVKRSLDQLELQGKQDLSDFTKRQNELEEQLKNDLAHEVRMHNQKEAMDASLKKAAENFVEEMEVAKHLLELEIKQREQVEDNHRSVAAELENWKSNADQREEDKRAQLMAIREDRQEWQAQRKSYAEQRQALELVVHELETRMASAKRKGSKRSKSAKRKASGGKGYPGGVEVA